MENDIPKSNILNIEIYMDKNAKEIVDSDVSPTGTDYG
jgi:hypothetical protein